MSFLPLSLCLHCPCLITRVSLSSASPVIFFFAGLLPVTADTCFPPSTNLQLTAAGLIGANYFSLRVNIHYWPQRERDRQVGRHEVFGASTADVFQMFRTKQTPWKLWPQFHSRWGHFNAAACLHYKNSTCISCFLDEKTSATIASEARRKRWYHQNIEEPN